MIGKFLTASLSAVLAVFSSTAAMGQADPAVRKCLPDRMEDFISRIELHGYAQAGYSYDDADGSSSTFNLKRTLLWAKARITDRWSFLFMHDFSSVPQEFYTDYRFSNDKSFSVRLGQFKHSFSMENPMSPTSLELIDVYSQAVLYLAGEGPDPLFGVNYGRDLGLMAYGDLFQDRIHYELAIMNGQGINRTDKNSDKDFIARLEVLPVRCLRIVASVQKGRGNAVGASVWNPGIRIGDDYRRDRLSIGAEWKSPAFSLRSEFLEGVDGDVVSRGYYLTGCVRLMRDFDAVASLDSFKRDINSDKTRQRNCTLGIQYWFYKKCRLQLQYTHCSLCSLSDWNWMQAQVQVGF